MVIEMQKLKFKKLHENAVIPKRANETDAGLDFTAVSKDYKIDSNGDKAYVEYDTGISVAIPEEHVGLMFPRSSVSDVDLILSNSVGVIDSGYRGSIKFRFREFGPNTYGVGDRIGQLVIVPIRLWEVEEVEEFESTTERGANGFGSSGK